MALRTPPGAGKTRTREHILADITVKAVERQVLLSWGTIERIHSDYGLDIALFTYVYQGVVENVALFVQVKSTQRIKWQASNTGAYQVEQSDLDGWMRQRLQVLLMVYDGTEERV